MKSAAVAVLVVLAAYGATSAAAQGYATVADAIRALPQTSTLASRLSTSSLGPTIEDPNLVATVFAPNNAAMAALQKVLSDAGLDSASAGDDASLLNDALKYHIVPGSALTAEKLTNGMVLKTQQGESVTVLLMGGNAFVEGKQTHKAQVVSPNIVAGKSIVHLINAVLLPQDVADILNAFTTDTPAPAVEPVTPAPMPAAPKSPAVTPAPVPAPVDTPGVPAAVTPMPAPVGDTPVPTTVASPAPVPSTPAPRPSPSSSSAAGVSVAAAMVALPALLALVL